MNWGSPTLRPAAVLVCIVTIAINGCSGRDDLPETKSQPQQETAVAESDEQEAPLADDPIKLREDALRALEAGDADAADESIRASLLAAPDDPQSMYVLALVLGKQHRFPEAIKMLRGLANVAPPMRFQILGQTADWMVLNGQWREAEERYRTLLEVAPDAMIVHRMLAQLLIRQGRRLEAATHLRLMCRRGDIEEPELRSLLMLFHPFARDATLEELDPISGLGNARYEISQGNWDAAVARLEELTAKGPAEVALLGRLYAQQQDFASLGKWAADATESGEETADHWFAMGSHAVHRDDHRAAVKCFCQAVLRDPTDQRAYALLSQSLEKLGADAEAIEAANRAELIEQAQAIGNDMAEDPQRDLQRMSELADRLDQLHRPFEALAWRAVRLVYGRAAMSESELRQSLAEINRKRLQRLEANEPDATERFLLCGVDLDALTGKDEAETASGEND